MECPKCRAATGPAARFCPACGSELPEPGGASTSALDAGGETRLLTALFADLSGSVAATHGLDPEAAADRVNEVLDVMAAAILRYEGHIDRYLGDGVLAFFGAPRAHEDDPIRAISAALEIRDDLEKRGFGATSGINTGEVYLGRIGSQRHAESSALGPVINLAARLQSRAERGQVLVGENTYRAARRWFEFRPVSVQVKGIPHPVRAHAALRPLPRPEKARGIEGLRAELVGREPDLAELLEALGVLRDGQGRAVAVIGEAGIGKSRLVAELKRHVDRGPMAEAESGRVLWLEGRCLETTTGTSYGPFLDLFQSLFDAGETGETAPERVAAAVRGLVEDGALPPDRESDVRGLLAHLLRHTDAPDSLFRGASPEQVRNLTFLAVRDFLAALAHRQPLVIYLDDLHWADSHSLDLAVLLAATAVHSPMLLLCAYRPDSHYPTARLGSIQGQAPGQFTPLRLRRLSDRESDRMIESLLHLSEFPRRLRANLLSRAEGNPLFLEEMLRSLLDAGVLVRRNGDWTVLPGIEEIVLPDSVQSIIQSRVDRLPADRRRLLQAAAVIGRVFARGHLESIARTAWGEIEVEAALADLEDHELVYLDRIAPEEEYSFKHVFTRDTVYSNLLRRQRAALHRAVAEATEVLYADALEEHCEQLARHYDAADDARKAIEYLAMAGRKAQRAFLNTAAIEYYERVLERLSDSPDRALGLGVRESLGDVYELAGRHDEALAMYGSACADTLPGDLVTRARILRKTGACLQIQRRPDESMAAFGRALETLGDPAADQDPEWWRERIDIALGVMMLLYFSGSADELATTLERHREEIETHGSPIQRGAIRRIMALVGLRRERYLASADTVQHARQSAEAIEESGVLQEIGFARFNYGFALLWAGQLDAAEPILRSALAVGERTGDVTLQSRCAAYLALLCRKRGDVEATLRHADRTLELAEEGDMREYLAAGRAHRAWVALRKGDLDKAEHEGSEALALWRQLGGPYLLLAWMPVWPLLGVAVARERWDEAAFHGRFLLEPERQPIPMGLAHALAGAVAAVERGDHEEARELFAEIGELARPQGYL